MSGSVKKKFGSRVTHLVAKSVSGPKYRVLWRQYEMMFEVSLMLHSLGCSCSWAAYNDIRMGLQMLGEEG